MIFKDDKIILWTRILPLIISIYLSAYIFIAYGVGIIFFTAVFIIAFQAYSLNKTFNKANQKIIQFFNSIRYDDFSTIYPEKKPEEFSDVLHHEFNAVLKKFREIRAEKEVQYQYLRTVMNHIGIGILTIEKTGDIKMMNTAARRLLSIEKTKNIIQFKKPYPRLYSAIKTMETGDRALLQVIKEGDEIELAIHVANLSLRGTATKLISIQNIQSELEEKEMEAWQNLIRVLTHEIINSVTPISSLASTVESEIKNALQEDKALITIDKSDLKDFHRSLKTIHDRSDGLIKFVGDFRNLTRLKRPDFQEVKVYDIINDVISLLEYEICRAGIKIYFDVQPENLTFSIDKQQIEQVIINLINNSIQSFPYIDESKKHEKHISIDASRMDENILINIKDNGIGIEEEALKKIFIPFFTTKKNGSGIGLSFSRQVMRNHGGQIIVKSILNIGTELTLRFK